MSEENVEAFKRGTDAYNRRDVEALVNELDPEVEWHSALLIPFGGEQTVSRGHDGVREVMAEIAFGTVTDMKDAKAFRIWTYLDPQEALEAAGVSE